MDPFDGSKMIPTGPRDGGQGRRHVSPVWWSSDDSGVVSSRHNMRRNNFALRDGTMDRMTQQEQPVQTTAPNPPPIAATNLRPDTMLSPNRLRRKPATASLSKEYRESGSRIARESREAGSVRRRTIRPTAATQGHAEGTNYTPRRRHQPPADMNQPGLVKISPDTRRVGAQTAAAIRDTGVGGQRDAHKASGGSSSSTESMRTRSSIASAEATSSLWTGNVSANVGPVQHFEAPNASPQRAEFLNVHSSSVREAPPPPAGRDHGNPQNQIEEQEPENIRRLRSVMAKYEAKVEAHVRARQRPRGPIAMPAVVAPYHAPDYRAPIADTPSVRHRHETLVMEELPRRDDSRLLRAEDIPGYLLQRSRETRASRPFQRGETHSYSIHEVQVSNGDFVLGQARAVRFSRPGRPTVVDVSSYGTRSFNAGFLGTVEADLVRSAGATARFARRTDTSDEHARPRRPGGVSLDGAAEAVSQMRGDQQAVARRSVPGAGENTDRQYWRPIGGSSTYDAQDGRFRQHLQRLEVNDHVPGRVSGRGPVQQSDRRVSWPAPVSGRTSAMVWANHPWIARGTQSSFLDNNNGHFGHSDNARLPHTNITRFSSPPITPTEHNPLPGDSGCPSLISDDGMEPFDPPEAVADEHGQSPVLQGLPEISDWEKEDSTMRAETSSEASSTLVQLNFDANELFSVSDTEAAHDENIRADQLHADRLHTGIGDGSDSERGRLSRAPGEAPPPIPPRHANHGSGSGGLRERHRQGSRTRFRG